jgi:hypothetical protein
LRHSLAMSLCGRRSLRDRAVPGTRAGRDYLGVSAR